MLLAMATGTGKTKTCIALIYRLLKAQALPPRPVPGGPLRLGEQAANAFKDTRMESLQTFADIFGIKELDDQQPDTDTAVHIATVQGMVQRVLYPGEDDDAAAGGSVRLHRRRRVPPRLPARPRAVRRRAELPQLRRLHLQVPPRARLLRRREDRPHRHARPAHDPDLRRADLHLQLPRGRHRRLPRRPRAAGQIVTELADGGIVWKVGEEVEVYDARRNQLDLFTTPDEIKLEVEDFNRKVITESFNRVVCEYLAQELDPSSRQKTLIFCVNDAHADLVVRPAQAGLRRSSTAASTTMPSSRSPAPPTSRCS